MFTNARLKLTAWYLLIIMFISVCFSFVIYRGLTGEVERFGRVQRLRIIQDFGPNPPPAVMADLDILDEVKQRIFTGLVVINGIILVVSGGLGFFLAGKTLNPIAEMMDEQNRFISDASHELRTPLTSLRTAMEVHLRDKNCTSDEASLIKDSLIDVNKLTYLSDQLLKLAQYKKPEDGLKFEKVNLPVVVKQVIGKMTPQAKNKEIVLVNKVKVGDVRGNKYSLEDLLMILLDNAIKYTPAKKKIVINSVKKNKNIYLSVKDEGIGIAAKDIPNIFDRFFRADSARAKSGTGGYGLGLSIAKRIVETHTASIKVESQLGQGTTFTIVFPALS